MENYNENLLNEVNKLKETANSFQGLSAIFEKLSTIAEKHIEINKSFEENIHNLNEYNEEFSSLNSAIRTNVIELKETDALLRYSGGDARKLLNILELVVESESGDVVVTDELVVARLQQNPLAYDKDGEMHYDIISAFIKSIRGSDPDAALYWMARMIEGGEDPQFIARRMVISASEDIGLANPNALLLANAAFDTVMKIGWPEARIALAECAVYLATSPKSNSAYLGIDAALALVRQTGNQPVPLPIRNAPTQLMKELGYHDGYKYPHDYPGHFTPQQYMPDELTEQRLWHGQHNPQEEKLWQRMVNYWGKRFED